MDILNWILEINWYIYKHALFIISVILTQTAELLLSWTNRGKYDYIFSFCLQTNVFGSTRCVFFSLHHQVINTRDTCLHTHTEPFIVSTSSALPSQTQAVQSEQFFVWLCSDWFFCAVVTVTPELWSNISSSSSEEAQHSRDRSFSSH